MSSKAKVLYAQGCRLAENLPSFELIPSKAFFTSKGGKRQTGLKGEYFDNRDFEGKPLYLFGHGLSYTRFEYGNLQLPEAVRPDQSVMVAVDVENIGDMAGEEVVQLYITDLETPASVPLRSLQGFQRVFLKPGQKKSVHFTLIPRQLSLIDQDYKRVVEPGTFEVSVGGKQPGFTGNADAETTGVVMGRFEVVGDIMFITK